jgi:acylphosphatase
MGEETVNRVHLLIHGDVQGVGYRQWVVHIVKGTGITGWVKNREDRSVELVAEGETQTLRTLVSKCRKGPEVAWVRQVDETWQTATHTFSEFVVIY